MIGATLTTRLAQDGIDKKSVTAFALAFLVYNIKFLWAPLVDHFHLPLLGRLGQRRSWLWLTAAAVAAATINLGLLDPSADLARVAFRSEEHTSELQSLMRISYAVFCLKKKKYNQNKIDD